MRRAVGFGESGHHEAVDAGLVEAAVEVAHAFETSLELLFAGAAPGEDAKGALYEGVDAGGGPQERGALLGGFLEDICHGGVFVQELAGVGHAVGDVAGLVLAGAHEDFAGHRVGCDVFDELEEFEKGALTESVEEER